MPPELVHPVAVFPARRFGLIQPHGDVSAESVLRSGSILVARPEWEPGFDEVWDLRFAGAFVIDPSAISRLRELEVATRERLAGSRTLFVTGDRPHLGFVAGFYGRLVRPLGRSVVACRTEAEALRYLGGDSIPLLGPNRPGGGPDPTG